MKKSLLFTLLFIPLALSSCGSSGDYQRCNSIKITGGGEANNQEPVKYIYAEYEAASSLKNYTIKGYGDEYKTVYVYTNYNKTYETYGFKEDATINTKSESVYPISIQAKLKSLVVIAYSSTEVYYSVKTRTIKVVQYDNYVDKTYDKTKLEEMKNKLCYAATLTETSTIINNQNSYYYSISFNPKKQETYTDLGTTAVTYTPYEKPEENTSI